MNGIARNIGHRLAVYLKRGRAVKFDGYFVSDEYL